MKVLVAATLTRFAMADEGLWSSWLANLQPDADYFAAIQTDAQGVTPFAPLKARLSRQGGACWTYSMDDYRDHVNEENRARHIAIGRNMIFDYAHSYDYSHVLMVDADIRLRPDTLERLLESECRVVGAYCPTFNQNGPPVTGFGFAGDLRSHLATGCLLIERLVFTQIRYRGAGSLRDDRGFHQDCASHLGVYHKVRHDVVVDHYPEHIVPIDQRGFDVSVMR